MARKVKVPLQGSPEPYHLLNRIPIHETGEPLVDIRRACPDVLPLPGCLPYLRRTVAAMLNRAQDALPPGHRFTVSTALRTLEMQSGMYWRNYERLKAEKPHWPASALRRATNKYFAAPDSKTPPGHTTGSAIDVGIVGPDYRALDMIAPTKGWEAAYTWSEKLGPEAKRNREMLIHAMTAAGFSNCRDEWWHWSYGDSAWAVRTGCAWAPYGHIPPPPGHTFIPRRPRRPVGYHPYGPARLRRRAWG